MTTPAAPSSARSAALTERLLFGLLLLLHAAVYVWLIVDRRMVRGHDSFLSFVNQYLFHAQATTSSEPMLWIPYVMHGRITNFALEDQGALLQNAMLLLGGLPAGTPFLPIFDLILFVDDLLLLTGIWWLGRRYYRSAYARFFVAAAALGSGMWVNHVYFNHRFAYAIPLILAALHDFLEDGRRWKLLLAGTLLILQFLGQTFYVPTVILLTVLLYYGTYALVYPRQARSWTKQLRPRWMDLGVVLVLGSLLGAVAFTLADGAGEIRLYRQGRNPDATVTLDTFVTYAGNLNPVRFVDIFLGITPSLDYTLYCGIFAVACMIAVPFLKPGKRVLHLWICLFLGVLFSAGFLSLPAPAAYELIYPVRYYRYVTLTSPIVKLMALLLAGHGFDALLSRRAAWNPAQRRVPRFMTLILFGVALVTAAWAVPVGIFNIAWFLHTGMPELTYRDVTGGPHGLTVLAAVATGLLLCVRFRRSRPSAGWVLLVLALQTADIYSWKLRVLREETVPLDDRQYAMQQVQAVPYVARRQSNYADNERFRTFHPTFFDYGAIYGTSDMFLHLDPPRSRFWTTYWLAPYDLLNRAYLGKPLGDTASVPADRAIGDPVSPGRPPSPYRKVVGAAEDKIQIFSDAHTARSDQELADAMNRPEFRGDVLLLSSQAPPGDAGEKPDAPLLSKNERLPASYEVLHFDANRIRIRARLPEGRSEGWLFYADTWHPQWTARVNDRNAEVRRAFLAYKAVKLDSPSSEVEFRFRSPRRVWSYRLLGLASLAVLGFTAFQLAILFYGSGRPAV